MTDILSLLDEETIDKEFIPVVFSTMEVIIEEITYRLAMILGKIVFKLKDFDLHLKYREQLISFFNSSCTHKELEMRRAGCFNLPCFHLMFQDYEEELNVDFQELYL
jgi:hypothetical protein